MQINSKRHTCKLSHMQKFKLPLSFLHSKTHSHSHTFKPAHLWARTCTRTPKHTHMQTRTHTHTPTQCNMWYNSETKTSWGSWLEGMKWGFSFYASSCLPPPLPCSRQRRDFGSNDAQFASEEGEDSNSHFEALSFILLDTYHLRYPMSNLTLMFLLGTVCL